MRRGASVECGGGCGGSSEMTGTSAAAEAEGPATARVAASSRAIPAVIWAGGTGGALRTARRDGERGGAPVVVVVAGVVAAAVVVAAAAEAASVAAVVVAAAAAGALEPPTSLSPLRRSLR